MGRLIDARIRPPSAALTRRLAARAAKMAVNAVQSRRSGQILRDPRHLWPDLFEE